MATMCVLLVLHQPKLQWHHAAGDTGCCVCICVNGMVNMQGGPDTQVAVTGVWVVDPCFYLAPAFIWLQLLLAAHNIVPWLCDRKHDLSKTCSLHLLSPACVAICQTSAMRCCAVLCRVHRYQEKFYFSPGDTGFKVWDTKFGRIGAAICWDQWFPEAARCMALMGAEVRGSAAADSASDASTLIAPARHSHMVSGDLQPERRSGWQRVCSSHMHLAWDDCCCWWWW